VLGHRPVSIPLHTCVFYELFNRSEQPLYG
jgi:hypothetical protein